MTKSPFLPLSPLSKFPDLIEGDRFKIQVRLQLYGVLLMPVILIFVLAAR